LVLADQPISNPAPAQIAAALLLGLRRMGLASLPWTKELRQWRARVAFLRRMEGAASGWPDVSDEALLDGLEHWLGPFLDGVTRLDALQRLDLAGPLQTLLTREQQQRLDRFAPTHLVVPSGSRIRLDYEAGDVPVLPVRLQEMFGCRETPRVADGQVPVMMHLLSPAGRPVQVTQDLASFWVSGYRDVRKELRGRYPKHHWPDEPDDTPGVALQPLTARLSPLTRLLLRIVPASAFVGGIELMGELDDISVFHRRIERPDFLIDGDQQFPFVHEGNKACQSILIGFDQFFHGHRPADFHFHFRFSHAVAQREPE